MPSLDPDDAIGGGLWVGESLDTVLSQWKQREGEIQNQETDAISIKSQPRHFVHLLDFVSGEYHKSKGIVTRSATAHGMGMLHADERYRSLINFEDDLRREVFARGYSHNESMIGDELAYTFGVSSSANTSLRVYRFVGDVLATDARMLGTARYKLLVVAAMLSLDTGTKSPGYRDYVRAEIERFWTAISNKLNAQKTNYKRISI